MGKGSANTVLSILTGLLVLMTGCGTNGMPAKSDPVRGQVFIVTEGSANIKLGLVRVVLLSDSSVRRHVEGKRAKAGTERAALDAEITAAEASLAAAVRAVPDPEKFDDAARRRSVAANARRISFKTFSKEYEEALVEEEAANRQIGQGWAMAAPARQRVARCREELLALQNRHQFLDSGEYYLTDLPEPISEAQTDADGQFTLRVPQKGKFAVAARAQRTVLNGTTEEYTWLINVPEAARTGTALLLSNHNLTTAGSLDAVIHTTK